MPDEDPPTPPKPKTGATIDEAVQELRELVRLHREQIELTGKTYQYMIGGGSGGGGGGVLTLPSRTEGGFPEYWQGVEGRVRRGMAGFETAQQTTSAVLSRSRPGRWLADKWRKFKRTARKTPRRIAGAVGGKVGLKIMDALEGLVNTIGAVIVGLVKLRDATDRWTEQSLNAAKKFAAVSGSMATAMAEREMYEMTRDVARGEDTAASTRVLVGAENRRKVQEDKIASLHDNVRNYLVAAGNHVIGWGMEKLGIGEGAEKLNEWLTKKAKELGIAEEPAPGLPDLMGPIIAADEENTKRFREIMLAAKTAGFAAWGTAAPGAPAPLGRLPGP